MKLHKLVEWDPSMYRSGDENDPRSPYYEEPPEPEDENVDLKFSFEILDKDGHGVDCADNDGFISIIAHCLLGFKETPRQQRRRMKYDDDSIATEELDVDWLEFVKYEINGKTYNT